MREMTEVMLDLFNGILGGGAFVGAKIIDHILDISQYKDVNDYPILTFDTAPTDILTQPTGGYVNSGQTRMGHTDMIICSARDHNTGDVVSYRTTELVVQALLQKALEFLEGNAQRLQENGLKELKFTPTSGIIPLPNKIVSNIEVSACLIQFQAEYGWSAGSFQRWI